MGLEKTMLKDSVSVVSILSVTSPLISESLLLPRIELGALEVAAEAIQWTGSSCPGT